MHLTFDLQHLSSLLTFFRTVSSIFFSYESQEPLVSGSVLTGEAAVASREKKSSAKVRSKTWEELAMEEQAKVIMMIATMITLINVDDNNNDDCNDDNNENNDIDGLAFEVQSQDMPVHDNDDTDGNYDVKSGE